MAYQVNLPSDTNKGRFNLYTGKYTGCENISMSKLLISYLQYDSSKKKFCVVFHLSLPLTMLTIVHIMLTILILSLAL